MRRIAVYLLLTGVPVYGATQGIGATVPIKPKVTLETLSADLARLEAMIKTLSSSAARVLLPMAQDRQQAIAADKCFKACGEYPKELDYSLEILYRRAADAAEACYKSCRETTPWPTGMGGC